MSSIERNTLQAPTRRRAGFSLIELVTVLVILGAVAAFAVPKLATSYSGFQQYAFRQDVLTAVRYAQKTAIAAGCEVRVNLDGNNDRVELFYDAPANCGDAADNFNDPVPDPTGGDFVVTPDGGGDLVTNGEIVFDQFGGHRTGQTTIQFAGAEDIQVNGVTGYAR